MEKNTSLIYYRATLPNTCESSNVCCNYVVCFLCLLLIFIGGCEREVVPQYLMGTWKTSAPQYEDRYLKIDDHTVIYGLGNGEEASHAIDKISKKQADGKTVYIFYYRNAEGEKETLTVVYRPDSGGSLQVKNNEAVWEKAKGDGVSTHEKTPAQ
jgi:hypothetical protein